MNKLNNLLIVFFAGIFLTACNESSPNKEQNKNSDSSLVNTSHLDYLTIPITFPNGVKASGIYIYAEAPDYHFPNLKNMNKEIVYYLPVASSQFRQLIFLYMQLQ